MIHPKCLINGYKFTETIVFLIHPGAAIFIRETSSFVIVNAVVEEWIMWPDVNRITPVPEFDNTTGCRVPCGMHSETRIIIQP